MDSSELDKIESPSYRCGQNSEFIELSDKMQAYLTMKLSI